MEQPTSALEAWKGITQTRDISDFFKGAFGRAGILVTDTGESFTAVHDGERIRFSEGIAKDVEFTVPITTQNVRSLVENTKDGRIDAGESWRIVQTLFTPMTEATLHSKVFTREWLLRLGGIERHVHVHLLEPTGGDAAVHTLHFENGRWTVQLGLIGQADRTFRLTPDQAMDYHKRIMRALRKDSLLEWLSFARWYRTWRKAVSSTR